MTTTQRFYLSEVKTALASFRNAHGKLLGLCINDSAYGIELNELISDGYPFNDSLEEVNIDTWVKTATENIDKAIAAEVNTH